MVGWHHRLNGHEFEQDMGVGDGVVQMVKHLSTMRETRVRSLGWEDPLEKEMAIHSRTIAWKIPWTEEPGRLPSMGEGCGEFSVKKEKDFREGWSM